MIHDDGAWLYLDRDSFADLTQAVQQHGSESQFHDKPPISVPENQALLLTVVDIILEIEDIVRREEITPIGTLDHTSGWGR